MQIRSAEKDEPRGRSDHYEVIAQVCQAPHQAEETQSRKVLLEAVWDTTADIETRTVDMHIRRLRAELGAAAHMVETVPGFGYRLSSED